MMCLEMSGLTPSLALLITIRLSQTVAAPFRSMRITMTDSLTVTIILGMIHVILVQRISSSSRTILSPTPTQPIKPLLLTLLQGRVLLYDITLRQVIGLAITELIAKDGSVAAVTTTCKTDRS